MDTKNEMSGAVDQMKEFKHDMLREIYEQPKAIADTLARYLQQGGWNRQIFDTVKKWLGANREIVIAASGSSRHAGLAAEIMIEDLSGIAVDVEYASEYSCRSTLAHKDAAIAVISQSGETADTLAALRKAIGLGHRTLAITNVAASSMAREAALSMPTMAGVEKAVPATKSFVTQLTVLYLLALFAAEESKTLDKATVAEKLKELIALPELLASQLPELQKATDKIAADYNNATSFLYLGRGVHYAIAREGALKLKESSYVQAEGYPAGELKHGPNALVSETSPLVILAMQDSSDADSVLRYDKTLQLMRDMRAQGANIFAIINRGDAAAKELATYSVALAPVSEHLLPICEVVVLQFFAYYIALHRGVDMDHPRNLVKAVVVE